MSTETLTQALVANVTAYFGAGSRFLIVSVPGPLTIKARQLGSQNKYRTFTGVTAGIKFTADTPDDGFDRLEVTCATAGNVTIIVGDDDVDFANAVTVTNIPQVQTQPAGSVSDTAPVLTVAATQAALFPANANRRRITVFSKPQNAGDVPGLPLRKTGGADDIAIIQPGQYLTFEGTYGLDYHATVGGDTLLIFEES